MKKLSTIAIITVLFTVGGYCAVLAMGESQEDAGFMGFIVAGIVAGITLTVITAGAFAASASSSGVTTLVFAVFASAAYAAAASAAAYTAAAFAYAFALFAAGLVVLATAAAVDVYGMRKGWAYAVTATGTTTVFLALFVSSALTSFLVAVAGCVLIGIIGHLGHTRAYITTRP